MTNQLEAAKADLEELLHMQTDLPEMIRKAAEAGDYKTAKELRIKQSTLADDILQAREDMLIALIDQNAASLEVVKPQLDQAKADQASLLAQRAKLTAQINAAGQACKSLSQTLDRLNRSCLTATAELNRLHEARIQHATGDPPPATVDFRSPEAWGAAGDIKRRRKLFADAPGDPPLWEAERLATAAMRERRELELQRPSLARNR